MANDEELNRAGEVNEQFRIIELTAETVTRPAGPQTPTVHSFLRHLRAKGLDCVPEPVSLDGETETLRFIEGESGGDGWKHQHHEQGLRSAAHLLRRIHDASTDWVPPHDAVFAAPGAEGGDVFVNGDPGPWNFVWRDGHAVALIDWDFLHRASRLSDVAYALQWFAPFRDDQAALDWHHFPEIPDRRARIEAFLDAYRIPPTSTSPTPSSDASATPASTSGSSPPKGANPRRHGSPREAWRPRNSPTSRGSRSTGRCSPPDATCASHVDAVQAWPPPMNVWIRR